MNYGKYHFITYHTNKAVSMSCKHLRSITNFILQVHCKIFNWGSRFAFFLKFVLNESHAANVDQFLFFGFYILRSKEKTSPLVSKTVIALATIIIQSIK